MAKYGKKAQAKVRKVMEEFKDGKLKSGRSGKKVTKRSQAVAIGLAEARAEGDKVPPARRDKKKTAKKSAKKRAGAKKKPARKKSAATRASRHAKKKNSARRKAAGKKRPAR